VSTKRHSVADRWAENAVLKLLHRFSPYILSAMMSAIIWLGSEKAKDILQSNEEIKNRIDQIELRNVKQDSEIQDHESRMVFGKTAREAFQADTIKQFEKLGLRLEAIGERLADMNVSIGQLRTTINERVPARSATRVNE